MKSSSYYKALPESMPVEDIKVEFLDVLKCLKSGDLSKESALEALSELSDRQWNAYCVLSDDVRPSVADVLISMWDGRCIDSAETIVSIVSRLGLGRVLRFLSEIDPNQTSPDVYIEIHEAVEELRDSVEDPYSGMQS
ncbi:hypothetical protein N5C80_23460 [Pseudomonas nicosulfuronedens]|uniref:hypothetical protein n=2 Tax=Pseudomonas nicosulfuronedens TaxID=2571105 RepID=UPI00244BB7A2|nr:hypothetical protein [Pseudomonas nicosulfuronedens]MDH1011696.1 hypothetical protein [Pseudomonas nicosulfuronedens]MDH1011699.1 hypothetical protein [Pseudomonas nicosulfuronedens]MDH2027433.1 hypothetical protein [Pseudomonas nicosulfuronedens]MDH2027436.1 hypothetical protein [Pseudomonas nicosulfuronedens]MDH2027439.1 hypothetical protein [Pseudomonas nicosulfuronedens]